MKKDHDVIVIGAGPAGATLAYQLAKRHIDVLVLEKERLPRYKCCAGGVTNRAAKLLDFDISQVVEDTIYEVGFTFKLGGAFLGEHSEPLIYTIMRDEFDHLLVHKAQQQGAVLSDGEKVTNIQVSPDWVEVSTTSDSFHGRIVVGADGAYSIVGRELNMQRRIEHIAAIESEITMNEEELARWKSRVRIDLGIIPGGYAWVFPKRNHLSVGAGCRTSRARNLNRHHQEFIDSLSMGNHSVIMSGSHLIPTCTEGKVVWQDRALLLGDAAGLADPFTGEGIYYAILSAQLAAPVIENCLKKTGGGLEDYQQLVEKKIMSELGLARTLSNYFVRFPRLAFRMLSKNDGVWRAERDLMLGETDYAVVSDKIGGFTGILRHLLRF